MDSKIKQLSKKATLLYHSKWLLLFILLLGITLRSAHYLSNRSLWLDEASVTLNIVNRSFSELLEPLEYNQGAPLGFLFIEKSIVNFFGNNEYSLRLYPFLCGIMSLFIFLGVAKYSISKAAIPIALALFALSPRLIYYSAEVKQYSSDVCLGLLLYALIMYIEAHELTLFKLITLAIVGATAIWLSHPAAFILAGIGLSLTLFYLTRKEWLRIVPLSIVSFVWLLSFFLLYHLSLNDLSENKGLLRYWHSGFAPFPLMSLSDFKWYMEKFFEIFSDPGGLRLPGIAAFTFLIGFISVYVKQKKIFLLLVSPIFFLLLASMLHRYPFSTRLILFITPVILLFIAEGVEEIRIKTSHSSKFVWITILVLLFYQPLYITNDISKNLFKNEEIKDVMNYVRRNWQDNDVVYVYFAASPAFQYYSDKFGFKRKEYILGAKSRGKLKKSREDLYKLRGNERVWIIFSHVVSWGGVKEEKVFLYHLDSVGRRMDHFGAHNASVYLYDLR